MAAISPIQTLPDELHLRVFSHFSPHELAFISRVSKAWYRLAHDLSLWNCFELLKIFPKNVSLIDEKVWKTYSGLKFHQFDFSGLGPIDHRVAIPMLARFFSRLKNEEITIEGDAGVTILTLPQRLCASDLHEILKNSTGPKSELRVSIYISDFFTSALTDKVYRVLITNGLLTGTSTPDDLLKKMNGRRPKIVEAVALAAMTFRSSNPPVLIFRNKDPQTRTYTHCVEQFMKWEIFVGNFTEEKLSIALHDRDENYARECGSVGVWDLDAIWTGVL